MTHKWTVALVEEEKARIKQDLDQFLDDPKRRLAHCLGKLALLESEGSEALLSRFILAVSALVHEERFGGMEPRQIDTIYEIAISILNSQGIDPVKSKLRFLYAELYQARSHIYRDGGHHWDAAWKLGMSLRHASQDNELAKARQMLSSGIRYLRLGDCSKADEIFSNVEAMQQGSRQTARARIGRISACRFRRLHSECEALIAGAKLIPDIYESALLEIEWEDLCLRQTADKDLSNILAAVAAGGSHHKNVYFLEAYLWACASPNGIWRKQLPLLRSVVRKGNLKLHKCGFLYRAAVGLENCYDQNISFERRLHALGEVLSERHKLVKIEYEILLLACAIVWLRRNMVRSLSDLCKAEYRALSLRMSDGKNEDVLGLTELFGKQELKASA
jgi:hypothetical protein